MDKEHLKTYRNWWAHDGMWYQAIAKECGYEIANRVNQQCIQRMAVRVMQNLVRSEAVDPIAIDVNVVADLYMKATYAMWPDEWVNTELKITGPDSLSVSVHRNFALGLIHQSGAIDKYECPCLQVREGWFQVLGVPYTQGRSACKMHNSSSCDFWVQFDFSRKEKQMSAKLVYTISGRFVKIEKIGVVPEGDRSNFHYRADVDGEEIKGKLSGIDYSITDDKGVVHVNIMEVLTTNDDEKIFIQRKGRSIPVSDGNSVVLRGEGNAATSSPKLSWINHRPVAWEAHLKRDSLDYTAEVYI